MKKRFCIFFIIILVSVLVLLPAGFLNAITTEAVVNGDFETSLSYPWTDATGVNTIEQDSDGNHYLSLISFQMRFSSHDNLGTAPLNYPHGLTLHYPI